MRTVGDFFLSYFHGIYCQHFSSSIAAPSFVIISDRVCLVGRACVGVCGHTSTTVLRLKGCIEPAMLLPLPRECRVAEEENRYEWEMCTCGTVTGVPSVLLQLEWMNRATTVD